MTPSFLCYHSISTACASADGFPHVCFYIARFTPKTPGKSPHASDPARFSKSSSFQRVPLETHRPAASRRPPHRPPCPAIGPGSGFPFSRKPETRQGRLGHHLRIFPVLSEGWGESAAPGRSAATAERTAGQSLNRLGSQEKMKNFRIFFRFSGRNGGSRNHSPRAPRAPPVGPGPMPATDAPPLSTLNPTANTGTASPEPLPGPV